MNKTNETQTKEKEPFPWRLILIGITMIIIIITIKAAMAQNYDKYEFNIIGCKNITNITSQEQELTQTETQIIGKKCPTATIMITQDQQIIKPITINYTYIQYFQTKTARQTFYINTIDRKIQKEETIMIPSKVNKTISNTTTNLDNTKTISTTINKPKLTTQQIIILITIIMGTLSIISIIEQETTAKKAKKYKQKKEEEEENERNRKKTTNK